MAESGSGKEDQPLLSQEEKKGSLQAEAQAENEAMDQQGEVSPTTVWMGYGCFSMICG